MIEQVGQGRMRGSVERTAAFPRLRSARLLVTLAALAASAPYTWAQTSFDAKARAQIELTHRQEGEAILALADAAMAGKSVPLDFDVRWQNDFIKAQRGTFVPFTLIVDASVLSRPAALVYVRAVERRAGRAAEKKPKGRDRVGDEQQFPVDAIFPVELTPTVASLARISRGFSIAPGDYDVYVVLRERVAPATTDHGRTQPKAAVVKKALSVPDFWSGELMTSTLILADRLTVLKEPVPADQLAERPYVIGQTEITPAVDRVVGKQEELIVVFLVYNATVAPDRQFDLKVEYHFFRKARPGDKAGTTPGPLQERPGESYVNRTDPQRFNSTLMGGRYDPSGGDPVMAGQVIPLREFQEGEYRLAVLISDLVSGKSITRDVHFSVGSQLD
jgi:hypothetical protein